MIHGGGTYTANYHHPAWSHPTHSPSTQKTATPTTIGSVPFFCFGYGQPGHKVADCPMKNAAPPTLTLVRQVVVLGMPHKNITRATHGPITHLTMEDAQNAPDMVYGMF